MRPIPSFFLLFCALALGACSLLEEESPEQFKASVNEIIAPSEVAEGASFEVTLRGISGCAEIALVEERTEERRVVFTVWLHEKDGICGIVPNQFYIDRTLSFEQAGEYEIVAAAAKATVIVR